MIDTNKNCYLNLIYRATKDGDDCKIYHQKTNNIPDTLTLIRTKQGIIFGGFTHIKIPSCTGKNFEDEKAFIFSLDFHKIYLPQKGHCSKHSNDNYGPIFGNNEKCQYPILVYGSNFFNRKDHYTCKIEGSYYNNFSFDYEINKGERNFEIDEIEVYHINYN